MTERLLMRGRDGGSSGVIAVYFSAKWCPPCRQFTPLLRALYERHIDGSASGGSDTGLELDVIFASADRTRSEFDAYCAQMPAGWFALPYEERELKEDLEERYGVNGLPTLLLLDRRTGRSLPLLETTVDVGRKNNNSVAEVKKVMADSAHAGAPEMMLKRWASEAATSSTAVENEDEDEDEGEGAGRRLIGVDIGMNATTACACVALSAGLASFLLWRRS